MDLTQAEAIADLIDASSEEAAKSALQSLQGQFSQRIQTLVESLIHLRIYVEAAIDFPEEEIDFLADGKVAGDLQAIIDNLDAVRKEANQGAIMREGMKVVIAGRPNAGKSSLLNALSGKESAIVTDIAGTTRDVLREHIHIDGMPLHIIDTAGLRDASDEVEKSVSNALGMKSRKPTAYCLWWMARRPTPPIKRNLARFCRSPARKHWHDGDPQQSRSNR